MSQTVGTILALSAGGVLGVNARYWLGFWFSRWVTHPFPWATFVINVSGSFAIGFLTLTLARWLPHPNARLFLLVGFLGGYTHVLDLRVRLAHPLGARRGAAWSLANLIGSTVAGFLAVGLGVGLARIALRARPRPAPGATPPAATVRQPATRDAARPPEAMIPEEARLLRLYVNGSQRCRGKPAYQAVVDAARAMGLAAGRSSWSTCRTGCTGRSATRRANTCSSTSRS